MADLPNNVAELLARETVASHVEAAVTNIPERFALLILKQHAAFMSLPSVEHGGTLAAIHAAADRLRLKISTITDAVSYARGKSERFVDTAIADLEIYCSQLDGGADALDERFNVITKIRSILD